jgi:hypothetical protein
VERGIGLNKEDEKMGWFDAAVQQYLNDHPELMNE